MRSLLVPAALVLTVTTGCAAFTNEGRAAARGST